MYRKKIHNTRDIIINQRKNIWNKDIQRYQIFLVTQAILQRVTYLTARDIPWRRGRPKERKIQGIKPCRFVLDNSRTCLPATRGRRLWMQGSGDYVDGRPPTGGGGRPEYLLRWHCNWRPKRIIHSDQIIWGSSVRWL